MNRLLLIVAAIAIRKVHSGGGGGGGDPPCDEPNGHLKIGHNCVSCSAGCKTCFGDAYWYQCSSCFSGYSLFSNLCVPKAHLWPFLIKFKSQTNLDLDPSEIFQIGSNSSNKYPDYDVNDPYPTYLRGYYFTPTSYMTSDNFNLSPWFFISIWIKPYSVGAVFVKRDSGNVLLSFSMSSSTNLTFNIKLANGNALSLQWQSGTSFLDTWNQIAITCDLIIEQWITKVQLVYNGEVVSQTQTTQMDYYKDAETAFIGNDPIGKKNFTGFIYSLNYNDNATYVFSDYYPAANCLSGCSFCNGDFTCPDDCEFGKFNKNGVCVDCLSECTYGCRTAERCNICETKECYSCSDAFVCDTCVIRGNLTNKVCECNLNSFFNETTKICDICDNGYCSQCLTVNYFDCKVCEPNYELIDTVCLKYTPSGWDISKAKPYVAFDSAFYTGTYQGKHGIFTTALDENRYYPFNNPELMDPVPIEKRGLYFSDEKYLNSSQIYLPHSFTMIICVNPKNGTFLEKESLSINSNGTVSIFLEDPLNNLTQIVTHSDFPLQNWTYFTLIVSYSSSTTTLATYSNGNLLFLHSYYSWLFRDKALSTMILGKNYDGFIYIFKEIIGQINNIVSYIENEANLNQLPNCDYDYTFDQNYTCIPCNSTCTIGCIREPNCNLCYDQLCRNCSGPIEESTCFNCSDLSYNLYPNKCTCDDDAFLIKNSSNWYCEHCDYNYCAFCNDNGHFECKGCRKGFLVDTVCLDEYPIDYSKCSDRNCLLTHLDSTQYFSGLYGIFIGGYTKNNFSHFNNSEIEDPIPAENRGFYLDGTSKFFQTENYTYLGHIFSFGGWFSVLGTGDILEHYNRLLLTSNGSLSITLQDRDQKEFTFVTPGMSFTGWNYLSYTVFYANSTTFLSVFLNNEIVFQYNFPNLLFRDISNSTIFIGKSQNSFFHGFLHNFKMWNFAKEAFNYEFKNEICGYEKNGTCLLLCNINEYYQEWEGSKPSCEKCLRSCDKGCIRKDTCNICQDVLCAVCPYFGRTFCSQCIPYAFGSYKCECIENYCLSLDRLSCIRFPYENSPEKYWIHFLPNTTVIVGKWSDNFIINTIHPWMIDVHLIDNDMVTFSGRACTFSPFYENFTCPFNVLVDPSYDINNGPITIEVMFQGYVYPITFYVSYDDFSVSIMNRPELLGVVFYAGFNYIQISPNEDISFNNDLCSDENCTHAVCEELLSQKSISSLGGSIDCTYSNPGTISIYVGHIKDNANGLIFREKVFFGSDNETNFKYLTVPWKLQKPPMPIPSIDPIVETCCSCIVIFDASKSSTCFGSLKYEWIFSDFLMYSGNENERIANITLQSCNIGKEHPQFNVTLIVTDNFEQQASTSITVNMVSDDVVIKAWKSPEIKAIIGEILKLNFQYQKSSKIHLDPNPMIIWSVYKNSSSRALLGNEVYESTGLEFNYAFTIKGEYIIILDAYFNDKTYKISANASIVATPPVPNLVFNGVNTYVYANSNITVNLTASYNGETFELDKGYAFVNSVECPNGYFVELKGDSFKLNVINKERRFNCSFTIGLRDYPDFESEVYWLYVVKGNIPRVYIVSMFPYLDPSGPVRLIADVADSLRMDISWKEKNGHPFIATTNSNQPSMTIKEFSMLCGIDYEFQITVVDPVSFVPVKASIKRYVNCPPNSGTFEIDPKDGQALNTQFNILFAGWYDLEGNDPISYQVFMQKEESLIAMTPKTTENKFQIVLGERGKVTLIGRVYDSRGTFSEVELQVDVNDSGYIDAKERSEILLNDGIETMDSNMLFSSINSIAHYASHNTLNQNELEDCVENLDKTLDKWMNSSMPRLGLSASSTVIDAVNTLLGKAKLYKEQLLLEIYNTQNEALNHTKVLDIHTYQTIMDNLDMLLDNLLYLSIQNKSASTEMDIFKMINKTYDEGSLKYLQTINPNENPVKYKGVKFNSTSLAADGNTLAKPIEYDSPVEGTKAKYNASTSSNPDSTSYLVSILSVAPFKSISDALINFATESFTSSESYEFSERSVSSFETTITKAFIYSNEITSGFVQPSLTKNTGNIINPVLSLEPVNEVSSEVVYEIYDNSEEANCIVYDLNIEKCSFKYCTTTLEANGVATCVCEIAGLVGVKAYPTFIPMLKDRLSKPKDLNIPTTGWIIPILIYLVLLIIFVIGMIDANKLDKFYGGPLKEEALEASKTILKEIKGYCENMHKKKKTSLDSLLEKWDKEKDSYDEDKEENGIYYKLRRILKEKLENLYNEEVLKLLLTVENVKNYINNCIDERNLEILEKVTQILLEYCAEFKKDTEALCEKPTSKIKKLKLYFITRWLSRRWKPVISKIRGAIIIASELRKGRDNIKERLEGMNVDECLIENSNIDEKIIPLEPGVEAVKITSSIEKWKDVILINLERNLNKQSFNLEILEITTEILIKYCTEFKKDANALCNKPKSKIIRWLRLYLITRWLFRRWKPVISKIRGAIIIASELRKGRDNIKERLEGKNVDECLINNLDIYKNIPLEPDVEAVKITNSVEKWKDVILINLERNLNKQERGDDILENEIGNGPFNSIDSDKSSGQKNIDTKINNYMNIDNQTFDQSANKNLCEEGVNLDFLESPESSNEESTFEDSSTFLSAAVTRIQNEEITSTNFQSKKCFGRFIESNDVLGVIGYTNLNVPRTFRFTYLMVAISTEVTIAISAFDNYNRQIKKELFIIEWQKFWIVLLSFGFGLLPLILKLFFNYNFISSQFLENKKIQPRNWSIIVGYTVSGAIFIAELVYSVAKLQNYPLTNFHAYMSYIAFALMQFIFISGFIFPFFIAFFHCCGCCKCFYGLWKIFKQCTKRITHKSENKIVPKKELSNQK